MKKKIPCIRNANLPHWVLLHFWMLGLWCFLRTVTITLCRQRTVFEALCFIALNLPTGRQWGWLTFIDQVFFSFLSFTIMMNSIFFLYFVTLWFKYAEGLDWVGDACLKAALIRSAPSPSTVLVIWKTHMIRGRVWQKAIKELFFSCPFHFAWRSVRSVSVITHSVEVIFGQNLRGINSSTVTVCAICN